MLFMKDSGKRLLAAIGLALVALPGNAQDAGDGPRAVTDMTTLMSHIIRPASDAIFYVARQPPGSDAEWLQLEQQALMLAESANLLLLPGYDAGTDQWARDTATMRDAAVRAWRAAQSRDLDTLRELNNPLYGSCESCHNATRQ